MSNLNGSTCYKDSLVSNSVDPITSSDKIAISQIKRIIRRGHDAEVRRTPEGGMKIYEIERERVV